MPKIPLEYFHCLDNVSSNYETLKTLPDGYIDWYRKNKVKEHLHEKFLEKIDKGEIKEDVISVVKTAIAPVTRYKYGPTVRKPNLRNAFYMIVMKIKQLLAIYLMMQCIVYFLF